MLTWQNLTPAGKGYPVWQTGLPALGGSPHQLCKRDQIKMKVYMDRPVGDYSAAVIMHHIEMKCLSYLTSM